MGLVDSLLNMPNRQVEFFRGMQITEVLLSKLIT